jgi:hypothetical protein
MVPRILNLALDGGEWRVSGPGHFTPAERALDPQEVGRASEFVWTQSRRETFLSSADNITSDIQPVA